MFVTIVTAFGLRSNQSRRVPNATDHRRRQARVVLGGPKPDVVKLLQRQANWVSCRALHCCSVDPGLLKVRLSPGSDRIADDAADSGLCQLPTSGEPPLTTTVEPSQSWSLGDGSCPKHSRFPWSRLLQAYVGSCHSFPRSYWLRCARSGRTSPALIGSSHVCQCAL